jgi:hypothetical protein
MEKRFRALRVIATFYKILAWIVLIGTIIASLFAVITGVLSGARTTGASSLDIPGLSGAAGPVAGILTGIVGMITGVIWFLLLYAVAEAIYVILSIEENTRMTAIALAGRGQM